MSEHIDSDVGSYEEGGHAEAEEEPVDALNMNQWEGIKENRAWWALTRKAFLDSCVKVAVGESILLADRL